MRAHYARVALHFLHNLKLANAFTVIRHRLASLFPIGGKLLIAFVQYLFVAVFSKVTSSFMLAKNKCRYMCPRCKHACLQQLSANNMLQVHAARGQARAPATHGRGA